MLTYEKSVLWPIIIERTRQVSSMIHWARHRLLPVLNIVFAGNLFCFCQILRNGDERTYGQHMRKQLSLPAVTVGRPSGSKVVRAWEKEKCACSQESQRGDHWENNGPSTRLPTTTRIATFAIITKLLLENFLWMLQKEKTIIIRVETLSKVIVT